MTPDQQKAESRKYLATPVCFVHLHDDIFAIFIVEGNKRTFIEAAPWYKLKTRLPAECKPAERTVNIPNPANIDVDDLLKDLF